MKTEPDKIHTQKNCIAKHTKCLNTAIDKCFERNPEVLWPNSRSRTVDRERNKVTIFSGYNKSVKVNNKWLKTC